MTLRFSADDLQLHSTLTSWNHCGLGSAPPLLQKKSPRVNFPKVLIKNFDREGDVHHEGFALPAAELLDDMKGHSRGCVCRRSSMP